MKNTSYGFGEELQGASPEHSDHACLPSAKASLTAWFSLPSTLRSDTSDTPFQALFDPSFGFMRSDWGRRELARFGAELSIDFDASV